MALRRRRKPLQIRDMLTPRQRQILEKLKERDFARHAANALGVSESTIYNELYRIRNKYKMARKYINTILRYRQISPLLDNVLSRRPTREEEEESFG